MELKKITERVYYIPGSVNIGVIKTQNDSVILIDTGIDDDIGKKILKLLGENNLSVHTIINTHSHADHCGANRIIQNRTGARIYAPEIESSIIQHPLLEPMYLFSGAKTLKDLENKFLMAQPSEIYYHIKNSEKTLDIDDICVNIVHLEGHTYNQIGVEFDNILFCADSIFSEETIRKHKILFNTDINKTKATLDYLRKSKYDMYVPAHASPEKSILELADINLKSINETEDKIVNILNRKKTTNEILKEVCDAYDIDIKSIQQYFLTNTVIMAYLSALYENGKIKVETENNNLVWHV